MVMPMRLELTRVAPLPPQSSVSAIPPRHHLRMLLYYTSSTNSSQFLKKKPFFKGFCFQLVRRKGFEPSRLVGTAA